MQRVVEARTLNELVIATDRNHYAYEFKYFEMYYLCDSPIRQNMEKKVHYCISILLVFLK